MKPENMNQNLPVFQRLQGDLQRIIESTPPGDKLVSEPELAVQLGVSRATLREAMRTFEGQGYIRRRQGVGTFVLDRRENIQTGLEVLESIETQAHRLGIEVKMGFLNINKINADVDTASRLGCRENTHLIRISRVIWATNRPVAYLIDILLEGILEDSDLKHGFTGSVLDLLIKRSRPELSHSQTTIGAYPANNEIAKKIQLRRGDVLLKFDALLYDTDQRCIDFSQSYFVPGFFKFHIIRSIGK